MSLSAATIRDHLAYHAWASTRLLDATAQLPADELHRDFSTSDRSILGTLAHIFAGDRVWLARVARAPIPQQFITDADYDPAVLRKEWPAILDGWHRWAAGLTDDGVQAELTYRDLKGREWTHPIWKLVLHVVNHGTHHRGQVAGFLRSMGHTPPVLDLIAYYRGM
jgi:uncharacterized damage-inducible protein DinB